MAGQIFYKNHIKRQLQKIKKLFSVF